MKLESVEEHNVRVLRNTTNRPPSRTFCPRCKEGMDEEVEMYFKNSILHLSIPPQKDVVCPQCHYETKIFVKPNSAAFTQDGKD